MKNYIGYSMKYNRIFEDGEACFNCVNCGNCKLCYANDEPCQLYELDCDNYTRCDDCGEIIERSEATYCEDTGNTYCEACCENNEVFYCEDCGCHYERDYNHIWVNNEDRYICENCYTDGEYFTCEDCGEVFSGYSNTVYNQHNCEVSVCDGCFENTNYCDDCDIYYIGDWCPCCEEERRRLIKNYSYKPCPQFFGAYETELTYGIELETENNPLDFAEALHNSSIASHIYCKRDGSLDNGVEIVSHPADKEALSEVYREVMKIALENEVVSWNNSNCGLHFHISRESLNRLYDDENGWEIILTYIFCKWQAELEKICGRRSQHYCNYTHYNCLEDCADHQDSFNYDRYKVVNTCNSATIEIRAFKGTLNFTSFKHRFNILEAIIKSAAELMERTDFNIELMEDYFNKNTFITFISDKVDSESLSWAVRELATRRFK